MGKDSLIKSTSKKKTKSASEEETKKKTVKKAAAKPKKAAKPKAAKKAPAKTTKAAAAKTTAKKTKSTAAKPKAKASAAKPKAKAAAAKPKAKTAAAKRSAKKSAAPAKPKAAAKKTKKATIPELLAKKFESLPGAPKPKPAAPEKKVFEASPPVVSASDPAEAARISALLMTKFSMAEIKAVAKPPEPKKPEAAAKPAEPEKPEAVAPETPAEKAVETPAAPADEPPVITTIVQEDTPEPISRGIKYGIAAAALIVLILLGISHNNSSKYYIHPKEGALEIWKGRFSPKDNRFFMVLHGVQLDQEAKALYSRSEVYPMIFHYYLDKADTLLEVPGLPDFEGIKDYLYQAESYVVTPEMKDSVKGRLNSIERMILLYKADVAISKNTRDSLKAALKGLQKASGLVANPTQQQEIDQKIERIKILREEMKAAEK